jgi:hypothetical protein
MPCRDQALLTTNADSRGSPHEAAVELLAQVLREGNRIKLRVQGTSMMPAIWPGDILTIAPAGENSLVIGNIAFILIDGRFRTHRVIGHSKQGNAVFPVTRGDALDVNDSIGGELLGIVDECNERPVNLRVENNNRWFQKLLISCMRIGPMRAVVLEIRHCWFTFNLKQSSVTATI